MGVRKIVSIPIPENLCCKKTSKLAVIYGHHMSDGTMFADLASFNDPSYAKDHEDVILCTREGERDLKVAVVNVVNANYEQPK